MVATRSNGRARVEKARGWILLLGLVLSSGCASFHREWARAEQTAPASPVMGAWEGIWKSEVTGHEGRLRCVVLPEGPTHSLAFYRANYAKVFRFQYKVPLEFVQQGNRYGCKGQADLGGLAGGVYTYEGSIEGKQFNSTYRSKRDHGTFLLRRPQP